MPAELKEGKESDPGNWTLLYSDRNLETFALGRWRLEYIWDGVGNWAMEFPECEGISVF